MEFFLIIFLTFILRFSRADEKEGDFNMDQPIYNLTGETFSMSYTAKDDLQSCFFTSPDGIEIHVIPEDETEGKGDKRPSDWAWNRYGMDTPVDCGIQINKANMNDSGHWKFVAVPTIFPKPISEVINVTIIERVAPDRIILNMNPVRITMKPDTDPTPINITCIAYKTIGNVTFTWFIGENPLTGKMIGNYDKEMSPELPISLMNVTEVFQYVPAPSHDHQTLKCVANHSKYTEDDLVNKTNIANINITVLASPVSQENIVFENHDLGNQSIEISFHANPPPKSIYWEMHDMQHPIRDKQIHGRYASLGWKSLGNGDYIATIRVSNLSESDEDIEHPNHLFVKNDIGETSYNFTFTFPPQPAKLAVGEIAGIVLGCLGAVCLIWLVVSQVRKRRKSKNITQEGGADNREEMRETPRTQREED